MSKEKNDQFVVSSISIPPISRESLETEWNRTLGKEFGPFLVTARREHNIIHHFLSGEWMGASLPNITDEELDESRWESLAKPLG